MKTIFILKNFIAACFTSLLVLALSSWINSSFVDLQNGFLISYILSDINLPISFLFVSFDNFSDMFMPVSFLYYNKLNNLNCRSIVFNINQKRFINQSSDSNNKNNDNKENIISDIVDLNDIKNKNNLSEKDGNFNKLNKLYGGGDIFHMIY